MRIRVFAAIIAMTLCSTALGQNFRVTTEINDGKQVVGESNTFFFQGRVFDISDPKGKEFTVYDPTTKRIRLIDTERNIQTELPTLMLEEFTAELKLRAAQVRRPYAIDPEFRDASKGGTIRLVSEQLAYEAETTEPRFAEAATEYRRFADWMCQLNAMHKKNLPPFPRMKLNAKLGEMKALPLAVQLRLGEQVFHSKHRYYWVLSRQDRELCERIGGYLADPKISLVDFKTYRSSQVAAR